MEIPLVSLPDRFPLLHSRGNHYPKFLWMSVCFPESLSSVLHGVVFCICIWPWCHLCKCPSFSWGQGTPEAPGRWGPVWDGRDDCTHWGRKQLGASNPHWSHSEPRHWRNSGAPGSYTPSWSSWTLVPRSVGLQEKGGGAQTLPVTGWWQAGLGSNPASVSS